MLGPPLSPGILELVPVRRLGGVLPEFTVHGLLARTEKTLVLTGAYRDQPAVVKMLISAEPVWRDRFAAEVATYRWFAAAPPPVRVPALLAAPNAELMVLERLPGVALAGIRYPDAPLDDGDQAALLDVADEIAAWNPPAGLGAAAAIRNASSGTGPPVTISSTADRRPRFAGCTNHWPPGRGRFRTGTCCP